MNFYKMKNTDIVLQNCLNPFTSLTEGQSIPITDGETSCMLEVVELSPSNGVCIELGYGKYLDLQLSFSSAIDMVFFFFFLLIRMI
jgi:hypothetical protein